MLLSTSDTPPLGEGLPALLCKGLKLALAAGLLKVGAIGLEEREGLLSRLALLLALGPWLNDGLLLSTAPPSGRAFHHNTHLCPNSMPRGAIIGEGRGCSLSNAWPVQRLAMHSDWGLVTGRPMYLTPPR